MRKHYDQVFKVVAEADARGLLDMLGALPLDVPATVRPVERELSREPIYIDTAFHVEDQTGTRIEHIEAFSHYQRPDADRVTHYGAELALKLFLPIRTTVLLMVEAHDPGRVETVGRLSLGGLTITLEFRAIRLWEIEAAALLKKGRPDLLPWIALTRCAENDWTAATRAIAETRNPQLGATFHMLGGLRYGKDGWRKLLEKGVYMIRDEVLRESWVVQEWLQEGRQDGRLTATREHIAELLDARFADLGDQRQLIESISDTNVLDRLYSGLLRAPDSSAASELLSRT